MKQQIRILFVECIIITKKKPDVLQVLVNYSPWPASRCHLLVMPTSAETQSAIAFINKKTALRSSYSIFMQIMHISYIFKACIIEEFALNHPLDTQSWGWHPPFGTQYSGFFRRYAVRKGLVRSMQKFCYIVRRLHFLLKEGTIFIKKTQHKWHTKSNNPKTICALVWLALFGDNFSIYKPKHWTFIPPYTWYEDQET